MGGSSRELILSTMHAAIGWTYIMEGDQNRGVHHLSEGWQIFPNVQRLSFFIFELNLQAIAKKRRCSIDIKEGASRCFCIAQTYTQ